MSRPLSPDELDLTPEVLSDADMAAWVESIESSPDAIMTEAMELTRAPRRALAASYEKASVTTGRAIAKRTMAALERRGLVKRAATSWQLTTFARNIGRYLAQQEKP